MRRIDRTTAEHRRAGRVCTRVLPTTDPGSRGHTIDQLQNISHRFSEYFRKTRHEIESHRRRDTSGRDVSDDLSYFSDVPAAAHRGRNIDILSGQTFFFLKT